MSRRPALLLAVALAAACAPSSPVVVNVQMPGVSPFPPGLFDEILVTEFDDASPPGPFPLGAELQADLVAGLKRSFKGAVSALPLPGRPGGAPEGADFWKRVSNGRPRTVLLAGRASFTGSTRKALLKGVGPADGPFDAKRRPLVEQRRYVLEVHLSVISADSGEVLSTKTFREERDFIELDKPPEIAFPELADRIRGRLLPFLLGAPTWEERALLRRPPNALPNTL